MLEFFLGLLFITGASIFILLFIMICVFLFYMDANKKEYNTIYMKFDEFKMMYQIKPKAYTLYDDCVDYQLHDENDHYDDITIIFHKIDAIRYFFWKRAEERRQKKNIEKKMYTRALEVTLASMQKDINDYRERTTKETAQKVQEIVNPQQPLSPETEIKPKDNTSIYCHVGADGQRYITITNEALQQMLIEYAAKFGKPATEEDIPNWFDMIHTHRP